MFETQPYNHCDYRCERCDKCSNCTVYKIETKQRLEHILNGENPYSMDMALADVGKAFETAEAIVRKFAENENIDLDAAMADYDDTKEKEREKELRCHPFYITAQEFCRQTHDFLRNADDKIYISSVIEEYFNELEYYHILIAAKVYRALSMADYFDEIEVEDSKNNTALILKMIIICREQLNRISYFRPETEADILPLLKTLDSLELHAEKFLGGL